MNGSNQLTELDRNTLRLCSVCQQKLNHRLMINPELRLTQMIQFLHRNGLKEYEAELLLDVKE